MKTRKETGNEGEARAVDYLQQKGWVILARNFRYKRGELDIVGVDNGVLVFVEVKFRKNNNFGYPENFVSDHQVGMLRKTALEFILKENWQRDIRFDIVAITGEGEPEHFEDAF
jgi:putative endonuclease